MSEPVPRNSHRVYQLKTNNNAFLWYTSIEGIMDPVKTLIDSGSSRNFLNSDFVKKHKIPQITLLHPRKVEGIDGKDVKSLITTKVSLNITIEGKTFKQRFYVMPLGDTECILGLSWLKEANPEISWTDMTLHY